MNTTKMTHTPESRYRVYKSLDGVFIISNGPVRQADEIAKLHKGYEHRAPLLCAAPELLAACKAALITLQDDEIYHKVKETCKTLESAISRAEGVK